MMVMPFMTAIAEIKEHPQLDWKIKHCQDYHHHLLPVTLDMMISTEKILTEDQGQS